MVSPLPITVFCFRIFISKSAECLSVERVAYFRCFKRIRISSSQMIKNNIPFVDYEHPP